MKDKNFQLIFIASQPRSGSTLLQSLVSNNEFTETTSEPWLLLPFLSFQKPGLQQAKYDSTQAKLGINEFLQSRKLEEHYRILLQRFLYDIYAPLGKDNTKYIVDKTPRYYEILDEIVDTFPEAKIIVLKRNPFSVLSSIIETWELNTLKQVLPFERDILVGPYLIQQFLEKNSSNENVLEVKYETLVADPEIEMKRIYAWLNLPYSPAVLDYKNNKKYEGGMGDPTGVKNFDKIKSDRKNNYENLLKEKNWRDFFSGYAHYLGEEFLTKYGDYSFSEVKETTVFNDFLFISSLGERQLKTSNLMDMLKMKGKMYNRRIRKFYFG